MTEVFSAETTIDRPVDAVWARLIDWDQLNAFAATFTPEGQVGS
jgi:uncharacterized protein YndB with AHSA1/START domain